jgi:hypothetical protein
VQKKTYPHVTVLIGSNGSKKSLLLRLLLEAGLGKSMYRGHGHPPIRFEARFETGRPANVIAISNTPWDRFPRAYDLGRLSKTLFRDSGAYVYIGQRAPKGNVSVRNNEVQLGISLMENSAHLSERRENLELIFGNLDLDVCAGIRLVRTSKIDVHRRDFGNELSSDKLERYFNDLPLIVKNLQLDRSVRPEAKAAASAYAQILAKESYERKRLTNVLQKLHPSLITFWVHPDEHKFLIAKELGMMTIQEWRNLLYLGFVNIEGINLLPKGSVGLPSEAKSAKRDGDLSSGQWTWLYNFARLELELRDNSLVLIDEPENSLHPKWQQQYVGVLEKILDAHSGCHAVISTHSALLAASMSVGRGNLRVLESQGPKRLVRARAIDRTHGWSADDIYQDVFGMDSSRSPQFTSTMDAILKIIGNSKDELIAVSQTDIELLLAVYADLPVHDSMRQIVAAVLRRLRGDSNVK